MPDLITILSSGAFSSVLVFLFRNWISERLKASIQHEYDLKLENHKTKLAAESEVTIEKLKAQLQIAAAERQFRFSHIFEKTAAAIANTFEKLIELRDAVYAQLLFAEGMDFNKRVELAAIVGKRWDEFETFYKPNRIYIPKDTDKKIGEFANALTDFQSRYARMVKAEKAQINEDALEKHRIGLENLLTRIPELLNELVDEFQRILGLPTWTNK